MKDLKALENGTGTFFYRHVGAKGPKTPPLAAGQRGGQAPALRKKRFLSHREGQAPALREHRDQRSLLPNASKYETPSLNSTLLRHDLERILNRSDGRLPDFLAYRRTGVRFPRARVRSLLC